MLIVKKSVYHLVSSKWKTIHGKTSRHVTQLAQRSWAKSQSFFHTVHLSKWRVASKALCTFPNFHGSSVSTVQAMCWSSTRKSKPLFSVSVSRSRRSPSASVSLSQTHGMSSRLSTQSVLRSKVRCVTSHHTEPSSEWKKVSMV